MNNPLEGLRLKYLIGTDAPGFGRAGEATVVSFDVTRPVKRGISIAYANLFHEKFKEEGPLYAPYLNDSDTAEKYEEGQIDPAGVGWFKNLRDQFERRKRQGFEYIELDNPDAYDVKDVLAAIDFAETYGLGVIAKNPGLYEDDGDQLAYVAHPNVYGIIVELGAGLPEEMHELRVAAGKPSLPVWFVFHGKGRARAESTAKAARSYDNMHVTYSTAGEYANAIDIT